MKALLFDVAAGAPAEPVAVAEDAPNWLRHLAATPLAIREVPDPGLLGPDWVVLRTGITGISGSDAKHVLFDFEDAADSPMSAFIFFPQVLGHEVVADVVEAGPESHVDVVARVVLNPWLSCGPRGVTSVCPAGESGDYSLCLSFTTGRLSPGI
ncbi:MAG: alcohol dehydrogenase catalytic domain-containing protein, partial [Actinomycetota bacterium]|nr:alcohol dehydrogenase catalytic domain-containing protein [Actinomycetota bacterium]